MISLEFGIQNPEVVVVPIQFGIPMASDLGSFLPAPALQRYREISNIADSGVTSSFENSEFNINLEDEISADPLR